MAGLGSTTLLRTGGAGAFSQANEAPLYFYSNFTLTNDAIELRAAICSPGCSNIDNIVKQRYLPNQWQRRTMCVLLCISVVVCVKEGACVCSSVLLTYAVPPAILNCSPQWLALWSKVTGSLFSLSLSSLPSVTPFLLLLTFLLFIYPVFFYVYVFAPSTPFVLTSNCPTLFMLWWLHCCLIVGHLIILKDELQNISVIPV